MPCLAVDCVKENKKLTLEQDEDSYCPICYTAGLGDYPSIMLGCGHIMHVPCLMEKLKKRWPGPRITFFFAECPSCRTFIKLKGHPELEEELRKVTSMYELVKQKAVQRMKFEEIDKTEAEHLNNPKGHYYNKPEEFAMSKLSYYICYKCGQPYFGGLKSCENDGNEHQANYKASELICGKCVSNNSASGQKQCKVHGSEYIEYKCRFCCSISQWFCWGTTHFCQNCHTRQAKGDHLTKYSASKLPRCPDPRACPLKIKHPPNGTEYAIGCAICRNHLENFREY